MRHDKIAAVTLAAVLMAPSVPLAQKAENAGESIRDERRIAVAEYLIARDKEEIAEFESLIAKLDAARVTGAVDEFKRLINRVGFAMQRELEQAKRKVAYSALEVRESTREARGERREAHRTDDSRDRAQARDDRRDLRDDKKDRLAATGRIARMEAIIAELRELDSDRNVMRHRALLGEFLHLLRADLRATEAELVEDRRERREDRRERRTDRDE